MPELPQMLTRQEGNKVKMQPEYRLHCFIDGEGIFCSALILTNLICTMILKKGSKPFSKTEKLQEDSSDRIDRQCLNALCILVS